MQQEGVTSHLKGIPVSGNNVDLWERELWEYFDGVSELTPIWFRKFLALPDRSGDFNLTQEHRPMFERRLCDFREDKPTMIVLQYSAMRREALTFWKYSSPKRRRYFITPAIDSPSFASCPPSSSKSFMKDLRNCFDIYFDFRIKHNGLP